MRRDVLVNLEEAAQFMHCLLAPDIPLRPSFPALLNASQLYSLKSSVGWPQNLKLIPDPTARDTLYPQGGYYAFFLLGIAWLGYRPLTREAREAIARITAWLSDARIEHPDRLERSGRLHPK
jgi:hypothetical protein